MAIALGTIDLTNFLNVIQLDPDSSHVAPNVYSIAQFGLYDHSSKFMNTILLDSEIIGFTMVWIKEDKLELKRLMIDKKFQQKGYGSTALKLIVKKALNMFCRNEIYVCTGSEIAEKMYKKFGFVDTGAIYEINTPIGLVIEKEFVYAEKLNF